MSPFITAAKYRTAAKLKIKRTDPFFTHSLKHMPRFPFKLYLIGDRKQTLGRPLSQSIREAGKAGIQALQFREKDLSLLDQYKSAHEIRKISNDLGMHLFINGRVDLALALDAEGVQLPTNGFPIGIARNLLGKHKWIAISCHRREDVEWAERSGADFAVLGPVYDTPSKRPYGPPLGIEYFRRVKEKTNIPLFAIGGINQNRLKAVFDAGADGVAMISAILSEKDIKNQCQIILQSIAEISKT